MIAYDREQSSEGSVALLRYFNIGLMFVLTECKCRKAAFPI